MNQYELHLPPSTGDLDLDCPVYTRTSCAQCDHVMAQIDAFIVRKHPDFEEHFCGEDCANDYYLERLRRVGL